MPPPPNETYHRNLAALRRFQPETAGSVDATPVPKWVTLTTGRDGSATYRMEAENGSTCWLGQSSMPGISAVETLAGFVTDGGSVVLPGVLTGYEPLVLAHHIPRHAAVFVIEQDLLTVRLALTLYDYTSLLDGGRLVFLLGEPYADLMRTFIEAHSGYELPSQLVAVVQRSAAEIAELERQQGVAAIAVQAIQNSLAQSYASAFRNRPAAPWPGSPRIALLCVDVTPSSLEQVNRIEHSLKQLSWPYEVCVPDSPARCHALARLRAIDAVTADLVLLVNGGAGRLAPLLPASIAVASWYLPDAAVASNVASQLAPRHTVFASSALLSDALREAAVPAERIQPCAPGADDRLKDVGAAGRHRMGGDVQVAIVMDLPDDRPEAFGISLPSHLLLWRALREIVSQNTDCFGDDRIEGWLEAAQRKSGVVLQEESIRRHFAQWIRIIIAPTCLARRHAQALLTEGVSVSLWGVNWPQWERGKPHWRGMIPIGTQLRKMFETTDAVVLPWFSATAVQTAMDALAAGMIVACREGPCPLPVEYPGLAPLERFFHFYRSSKELVTTVRRWQREQDACAADCEVARQLVLREHTVARRLEAIAKHMQHRQSPATLAL